MSGWQSVVLCGRGGPISSLTSVVIAFSTIPWLPAGGDSNAMPQTLNPKPSMPRVVRSFGVNDWGQSKSSRCQMSGLWSCIPVRTLSTCSTHPVKLEHVFRVNLRSFKPLKKALKSYTQSPNNRKRPALSPRCDLGKHFCSYFKVSRTGLIPIFYTTKPKPQTLDHKQSARQGRWPLYLCVGPWLSIYLRSTPFDCC